MKIDDPEESLEWKDAIGRKFKEGTVRITSELSAEIMPSIEIPENIFSERMQELLRPVKVIAACDASVKKRSNREMLGKDDK